MRLDPKFVQHWLVLGLVVRLNFGNLLKFDGEESSREEGGRGRDGDELVFMYITVASSALLTTLVKIIEMTENIKYRYALSLRWLILDKSMDLSLIAILHGEASPEIAALLCGRRGWRLVCIAGLIVRVLSAGRLPGRRSPVSRISITVRSVFFQT